MGDNGACKYTPGVFKQNQSGTVKVTEKCSGSDDNDDPKCTKAIEDGADLICKSPNVPIVSAKCSGPTCNAQDFVAGGVCCQQPLEDGFANRNGIMKRYHKKTFIEKLFVLFTFYTILYLLYRLAQCLKLGKSFRV